MIEHPSGELLTPLTTRGAPPALAHPLNSLPMDLAWANDPQHAESPMITLRLSQIGSKLHLAKYFVQPRLVID